MPEHLAGSDIEGGQQHLGAVSLVLVLVTDGAVVARDVRRVPPLEGLHGLLVDADHDLACGWVQIEVADGLRLRQEVWIFRVQPLRHVVRTDLLEAKDPADLAGAEAIPGLGGQYVREPGVGPDVPEPHDLVIRPFAGQPHQLTPNRQRHRRRPTAARGIVQRFQRRHGLEPSLPLSHRARRPPHDAGDLLGPVAGIRQHHDPGALDDQVDVAPAPHELLELAQQVALNVESTWLWSSWHAISIYLMRRLFPKTRIELRGRRTSVAALAASAAPGRSLTRPARYRDNESSRFTRARFLNRTIATRSVPLRPVNALDCQHLLSSSKDHGSRLFLVILVATAD